MLCKGCGREIAEDREYCEECEVLEQDTEVIHITEDDIKKFNRKEPRLKAEGKFIDIEGYARSLVSNITNLIALAGAVLMYLSPYSCWLFNDSGDGKVRASLFDISGRYVDEVLALKQPVIIFACILLLLSGVMMLVMTARENIRPLRPYADSWFIRLIPVVISIAGYVLVVTDKAYRIVSEYDGVGEGAGRLMCAAAIILYTLSVVLDGTAMKDK